MPMAGTINRPQWGRGAGLLILGPVAVTSSVVNPDGGGASCCHRHAIWLFPRPTQRGEGRERGFGRSMVVVSRCALSILRIMSWEKHVTCRREV
jgi:hypothetical protein